MRLAVSGTGGNILLYDTDLEKVVFKADEPNCSFLCFAENGFFFAVNEREPYSDIALYCIDEGGHLEKRQSISIKGGALCHLSYSKKHSALFGACYADGVIFVLPFSPSNGKCGEVHYHRQGDGNLHSSAHCIVLTPYQDALLCANIALDRIYRYDLTPDLLGAGDFTQSSVLKLPSGIGPRHILLLNETDYYVVTEYSNELLFIKGEELICRRSTVAPDFNCESYSASIAFDEKKRLLYVSNRGENTIAVFSILQGGTPVFSYRFSCGNWPRHIALCENGNILAVAASKDNRVELFTLNDGKPCKAMHDISLASASFVCEY